MLWNHNESGMCIYKWKVSVDVVYGSLQNIKETRKDNDKNSQQKMKLCTKGGMDLLLNRRIEGWGEKEECWSRRLFQARNKVWERKKRRWTREKEEKTEKQSRAGEVFKHCYKPCTLARIKWRRRNRVFTLIVCGASSLQDGRGEDTA